MNRNVVVWGNCQAEPLAALLAEPLARVDLTVVPVPPVFLVDQQMLARVYSWVAESALLLSQPISDEYRVPGCGTDQVAAQLPAGGRLIRLASAFDAAAYPFQFLGHDGAGQRIAAPVTEYHDLRVVVAAARGVAAEALLENWPHQPSPAAFDAHADYCRHALTTRESGVDVAVSPIIRQDTGMFTVNHPSNRTLVQIADRVLRFLGIEEHLEAPKREFLGGTRTAVEPVPAQRLRWTQAPWRINGVESDRADVIRRQLAFYGDRPDVVRDSVTRFAERIDLLRL